jgi:hypothetical protein
MMFDKQFPSLYNIVKRRNVLLSEVMSTIPLHLFFRRPIVWGSNWPNGKD